MGGINVVIGSTGMTVGLHEWSGVSGESGKSGEGGENK